MINEGRLDDAIALLVDIAQRDPEQMERVQNLILEIRGIKSQVNELFDELNAAIVQGDEDLADQKIREIKELDTDPNRNTLNNLILAAIVVSKAVNDRIRDGYYDEGNALLEAGQYPAAVDAYREGFVSEEYLEFYDDYVDLAAAEAEITRYLDDPSRQRLIWDAYSTIAPEGNAVITNLQNALDVWNLGAQGLPDIVESTVSTISSSDPEQWNQATVVLAEELRTNENDMREVRDLTEELENLKVDLYSALDGVPEDFRYERIGEFLTCRPGNVGEEGILLSQELMWEDSFFQILNLMDQTAENSLLNGRLQYQTNAWDAAEVSFAAAETAAQASLEYLAEAESYRETLGAQAVDRFAEQADDAQAYANYVVEATRIWTELVSMTSSLPDVDALEAAETGIDIERIDAIADTIQVDVDVVERLAEDWNEIDNTLSLLPGADSDRVNWVDERLREDLSAAVGDFKDSRLRLYVNSIIPLFNTLEESARSAMQIDEPAVSRLINGPVSEGSDELPRPRPSLALETQIGPSLIRLDTAETDIGNFLDVLDEMLNRQPPIDNPEEVISYRQRAENLVLDVNDKQNAIATLEREASILANAARRAETSALNSLQTARRDLDAAQAAVERGQSTNDIDEFYRAVDLYGAVEESLNNVDELYLEVLVNDVDIAAASGLDQARSELRNQVQSDRSRLAVTVKQNAVAEARAAYDDGRYAFGVGILNQSQDFWNRAYGEDDPELDGWLTRLLNAQQALGQTVIEPTDPLFAEMNQYLNLANRYYLNGVRIAEEDPRNSDALKAFRSSEDLIRQVLNTFPGNEAALLLEQKILRQTDEEAWNASTRTLVTDTRRAVTRNDLEALRGDDRQKGLYAQVLVLRTIAPDYPGLGDLIESVEISLGLIPEPVDPADRAESLALSAQAWQIWTNLGTPGADRAIELLDTALGLWFENIEASNRKNTILLESERVPPPPWPAEALSLFQQADQAYSEGNIILAQALLNRFDRDYSAYTSDPRIAELRRKIEARQ
jgi:hypothetical protein